MELIFGEAFDVDPKVTIRRGSQVPFIEMADVKPWTRTARATAHRTFSSGSKFIDGDVLLARITPSLENGKASIYRAAQHEKDQPAAGSTEFFVIRGKHGVSLSEYAYYLLRTDELRSHLIANMNGSSGRQRVRPEALHDYPVTLPNIADQRKIVEFLSTVDDKIDSNTYLEDLIPRVVHAFVEQEISNNGGSIKPVSALAKFINGGAYTKGASGSGRMVIRIADLNSGPGTSTVYNDIDVPTDRLANPGDLLMSWSGSLGVYVWCRPQAIVNQHIFKVIPTHLPTWFVHNRLNAAIAEFQAIAADKATTMGHIQRKHLDETFVSVPSLEPLDSLCAPLWERYVSAQRETQQLSHFRDAILPELLSGRMRVDEAGRLVTDMLGEESIDD